MLQLLDDLGCFPFVFGLLGFGGLFVLIVAWGPTISESVRNPAVYQCANECQAAGMQGAIPYLVALFVILLAVILALIWMTGLRKQEWGQ